MGLRASGFWLVAGALLTAGILVFTAASLWLAYPQAHQLVVIVGVTLVVALLITGLIFGWSWLRWAFREARARGESMLQAIVNVARLALATRRGRAALGAVAFGIAIGSSPGFISALQQGRLGDAVPFGLLLTLAIFLNALAIVAGGSAAISDTGTKGLAKWERVFGVEDEVGPAIDFAVQSEVRIRIKPLRGNQWRWGLKFSASDEFDVGRYGSGHALWHLTKDENQDALTQTYYDELSRARGSLVRRLYHDDEITVVVRKADSEIAISVDGDPGWTGTFDFHSHRHALPTAWADGRDFLIKVQLETTIAS